MRDLYSKTNAPYLIAGALATLVLLASGTLAVAPYVAFLSPIAALGIPLPVILTLFVLSAVAIVISCRMIKKIEVEKNKFAEKEQKLANVKQQFESKVQELENKITLGKEAANKEVEKLKHELTQEKQNLDKRAKKLNQKVNELEAERKSFLKEKESLEKRLEAKANHIFEITDELKKITKEKDELGKQEEELLYEITRLCEHLQEKEGNLAEKEKRITELKRKIDNNKYEELQNKEIHKEKEKLDKEIEKLCKEKHILYNKKEELYKRQEELYVELDELQCRFKEINQKNKNLSQELKKKFEELDEANGLIENQSSELDGIRKDCNNEVKSLKNLLLKQDAQIEQLEEGFLKEKKEQVNFMQLLISCITDQIEGPTGDNDEKAILNTTQILKFALQKEIARLLSDETPASSLEDLVYALSPNETSVPLHEEILDMNPREILDMDYLTAVYLLRPSCQFHHGQNVVDAVNSGM